MKRGRSLRVGNEARFHADRGREFFIEPQGDGTLKVGSAFTFSHVRVERTDGLGCIYLSIVKEDDEADQEVPR